MNDEEIKKNLRSALIVGKSIYGLRVSSSKTSTSSKWKFFIPTVDHSPPAINSGIRDITGYVARVTGKKWDDKDGTYPIKGGNGHDVISALAIELYGNHDAIDYKTL